MARINIEECWWSDPRRDLLRRLLGNEIQDQVVIRAWRLAQEFWAKGQLIPWNTFKALEGAQALLEAGLSQLKEFPDLGSRTITVQVNSKVDPSEVQAAFVYVRGSSEYLSWVREQRVKSIAGGKKSAERPRDKRGRLLPKVQADSKPDPSEAKLIQVSVSGSGSKERNTYEQRKRCSSVKSDFDLEKLYEGYPRKKGKTPGLQKLAKDILSQEAFEQLAAAIANYAQDVAGKDPQYVMHFSTFAGQWRDWVNVQPDAQAYSINTKPLAPEDLQ